MNQEGTSFSLFYSPYFSVKKNKKVRTSMINSTYKSVTRGCKWPKTLSSDKAPKKILLNFSMMTRMPRTIKGLEVTVMTKSTRTPKR